MEEAIFSLHPGGPYAEPTDGVAATVDLWCYEDRDLLVVQDDPDNRVAEELKSLVGQRDRVVDGDRSVLLTRRCLKPSADTVDPILAAHDCLLVPPLRYSDNRKICRVWAFDQERLTAVYHDLCERWSVEVEAKRTVTRLRFESPVLSLQTVLPSLSDRQREVLEVAHEGGYYAIPRETTTAAIADELGLARRTAEDHLRRAEGKLVDAVMEYL
ncbi:MAG: helix-turn-helix domain-containing protein [Halobacteriota archaeon]